MRLATVAGHDEDAEGAFVSESNSLGSSRPETLYLDLLNSLLINAPYLDDEERIYYLRRCIDGQERFDYHVLHDITRHFPRVHREFERSRHIGQFPFRKIHNSGFNHSMIGRVRMDHLHRCMDAIRTESLPGDLMECGVWRGGACIFLQGYLRVFGMLDRDLFVADSFEGLPSPREKDRLNLSRQRFPELAVRQEDVEENFRRYGLLDPNVVFLPGWFEESLPVAPVNELALLRLDGDLYSSTMDALIHLYDRVVPGGFVIVDDYRNIRECREAVNDFFRSRGERRPQVEKIDWTAVYWRKA